LIKTALITYNQNSLNAEHRDKLREMFARIFTGGILLEERATKETDKRRQAR
jgi:hypothetical protein